MKPSDFKVGQIYKMNVASRSHVKQPYYVEIVDVDRYSITTNIPDRHQLEITQQGELPNWDYHIPRMEYVGEKKIMGYLLLNQKNILPT